MILSASGGLVYHARAAFSRLGKSDPWSATRRPICRQLSRWLNRVHPQRLILVGPSAAYLIEHDFFRAHDLTLIGATNPTRRLELVVVDPDPVAALVFRARFRSSPIKWHLRSDLLPFFSRDPGAFRDFLKTADADGKKTAILFFGLLGQIHHHSESFTRSHYEARSLFFEALKDRDWASLHDLESTTLEKPMPQLSEDLQKFADEAALSKSEAFQQTSRLESLASHLAPYEPRAWTDHETDWIGPPIAIFPWLLSPENFHILGFSARGPSLGGTV